MPLRYTHIITGIDVGTLKRSSSAFGFDEEAVRATIDMPFFTKTVVETLVSQCGKYCSRLSPLSSLTMPSMIGKPLSYIVTTVERSAHSSQLSEELESKLHP